jgi:hypothetical protein
LGCQQAAPHLPRRIHISLVKTRYQALGGKLTVIRKPGGKHHSHSLPDAAPIVDFAVLAAQATATPQSNGSR